MIDRVDPTVEAAVAGGGRVRVIVTFDHERTLDDLEGFDVVFNLASISAAALRVDRSDLDRLIADACVLRIEADGEVRALQ